MQTKIPERIYERVKAMPAESQIRVLSFIEDLQAKSETVPERAGLENLWREIDEIVASVPDDAWDEIPTDGAANHDHYLYGAPKRY